MGFQTGSQIRPELGTLDYSGYTNAANIQAQAMANLGQQIGGAIEGFYEDKEKKKEDDLRLNAVKSFLPSIGIDKTNPDFDQLASSLSKNKDLLETYTQIGQITKEQEARKNAIASAYTVTKDGNKFDPKVAVESYIGLSGNDPAGFGQIVQSIASQPEQKVILTPEQVSAYVDQGYALQGKPTPEGGMEVDKSSIKPESGPLVSVDLGGGKDKEGLTLPQQEKESIYQSNINSILSSRPKAIEMSQLADEGMSMLAMGTKTGLGQDAIMKAKQIGNMLGLDFDISDQEQFKSRFEPLMMEKIAETKGAISDREMNLFKSWVGSLDKTPEGNMKFFKSLKKASENQKATSEIANRMIDEGASASQINAKIDEYLINNPVAIYSSKDKKDASGETEIVNSLPKEKADRLIYLRNKLNK